MTKRIALVTGGMGGIGQAISIRLHDAGYTTVVTHSPANREAPLWIADMADKQRRFPAFSVDVADYDSCHRCIERVQTEIGPVDILVNNAGITRDASFMRMDKASWEAVLRTNLDSMFNMTRPVYESMMERGWGRIVNVSSVNGSKGAFGQTNYSAAKAGVQGFTRALALEAAARGVTVNTVSPGYIATSLVKSVPQEVLDSRILPTIPVGRLGQPDEVAALVAFLCTPEAAFITGANIAINGGQHLQ